jgi:hypothetical protein
MAAPERFQYLKGYHSFWTQPQTGAEPMAGPTGIEPAAYGLRVRRSNLTELRAR